MVNSKKEDDGKIKGSVQENQTENELVDESSSVSVSTMAERGNSEVVDESTSVRRSSGIVNGLAERLSCILRNEGDCDDLLLHQSHRENNVVFLQWLQALDLQVIGACRADERLKPLLKLKVSNGAAEDRFLNHLSQHFELPEVGMLARCLCIPLVSVRVGKVIKRGTRLCPTGTRGRLNLTLLPSSDLRISFAGDDGCTERLGTLSSDSESSAVEIEEIPADKAGRSFLVKFGKVSYFWCAEQSTPFGFELLAKMKDLLSRRPSLAHLTSISESRLDYFANHLHAYVLGSVVSNIQSNPTDVSSSGSASDHLQLDPNARSSSPVSTSSRSRQLGGPAVKPHSVCQGSLSPRSNPFKDGLPRNFSTVRSGSRERFRRRGDSHYSISGVDSLLVTSTSMGGMFNTSQIGHNKHPDINCSRPLFPLSFLEPLGNNVFPTSSILPPPILPSPQVSRTAALVSPDYCWCSPCTSELQYTVTPSHLPVLFTETPSLPSLSSLISTAISSSSLSPPIPTPSLANVPCLCIPALLPDPVVRVPCPVSSFITMSSSPHVPTFTPFIGDPIVHIPIIGVCSSGNQSCLVSTGPAIPTTISPLYPSIVNKLIPETESLVDKGARETLRLLLGSSQTKPKLMEVLPDVVTSTDEKHSKLVFGSRGLYSGTTDLAVISRHVAAIGFVSLPKRAYENDIAKVYSASDADDVEEENLSNGSEKLETSGSSGEGMEDSILLSIDDAIRGSSNDV